MALKGYGKGFAQDDQAGGSWILVSLEVQTINRGHHNE
jgi:hypothetical protein